MYESVFLLAAEGEKKKRKTKGGPAPFIFKALERHCNVEQTCSNGTIEWYSKDCMQETRQSRKKTLVWICTCYRGTRAGPRSALVDKFQLSV